MVLDRRELEAMLAEGCSLEEIGRRAGRHPSTVSYWLRKHGLTPAHRDRHANVGGLDRSLLADLVARGLSIRQIAREVDRGPATVRYWLSRHGLKTRSWKARPAELTTVCAIHGPTPHGTRSDGYARCLRCRSEAVTKRRRAVKKVLVDEAGGACARCGYARCLEALQFHHRDPSTKRFGLAHGITRSIDSLREEAHKCVLLCSNCHAEVEAGVATLS
jgi:transposase